MAKQIDWKGAQSFEEYVFTLFEDKKTESPEFKTLLRIYGREKMEDLWKKYMDMKKTFCK